MRIYVRPRPLSTIFSARVTFSDLPCRDPDCVNLAPTTCFPAKSGRSALMSGCSVDVLSQIQSGGTGSASRAIARAAGGSRWEHVTLLSKSVSTHVGPKAPPSGSVRTPKYHLQSAAAYLSRLGNPRRLLGAANFQRTNDLLGPPGTAPGSPA